MIGKGSYGKRRMEHGELSFGRCGATRNKYVLRAPIFSVFHVFYSDFNECTGFAKAALMA